MLVSVVYHYLELLCLSDLFYTDDCIAVDCIFQQLST